MSLEAVVTEMKRLDLATYGMEALEKHADMLNAISEPDPTAVAKYEIMSGSLIWSDEKQSTLTADLVSSLRQVWHFRTHCILRSARIENEVIARCEQLFPNWVGFLPERWVPTPELLAEYRRGDIAMRWCLRSVCANDRV